MEWEKRFDERFTTWNRNDKFHDEVYVFQVKDFIRELLSSEQKVLDNVIDDFVELIKKEDGDKAFKGEESINLTPIV